MFPVLPPVLVCSRPGIINHAQRSYNARGAALKAKLNRVQVNCVLVQSGWSRDWRFARRDTKSLQGVRQPRSSDYPPRAALKLIALATTSPARGSRLALAREILSHELSTQVLAPAETVLAARGCGCRGELVGAPAGARVAPVATVAVAAPY